MPQTLDDVKYLSSEIGPRPAGTEEEQQAALYITEQFQKEAGFTASIEDFKCASNYEIVRVACFGAACISALLGFLVNVPAVSVVCIVVSVIAAVLYVLEVKDKPILSKALSQGISQNVIAKYEPYAPTQGKGRGGRSRKVILVASYDSGKVEPENKGPVIAALPIVMRASGWALVVMPVLLLLNALFFSKSVGILSLLASVLIVAGIILLALRAGRAGLHMAQPLNDGANFNAAGTAALLEIARRIGNGRMSEAEIAENEATVHTEEEAREAGLIPEGVEVAYTADRSEGAQQPDEGGLAAAKAAIAALTGRRIVEDAEDISGNLVQVEPQAPAEATEELRREQNAEIKAAFMGTGLDGVPVEKAVSPSEETQDEGVQAAFAEEGAGNVSFASNNAPEGSFAATPIVTPSFTKPAPTNVPDWYSKAKSRARREKVSTKAHRSRYADALAQAEMVAHESEVYQPVPQQPQVETPSFDMPVSEVVDRDRRTGSVMSDMPSPAVDERSVQAGEEEASIAAAGSSYGTVNSEPAVNRAQGIDVSRETIDTGRENVARSVSRETIDEHTESETPLAPSTVEERDAMEPSIHVENRTVSMAPIDVSDLIQEMSDMKAPEMKDPCFVDRFVGIEGQQPAGAKRDVAESDCKDEQGVHDWENKTIACAPVDVKAANEPMVSTPSSRPRAHIVLPDVPEAEVKPRAVREVVKQRAPLAEAAAEQPQPSVRERLSSNLPEVGATVVDNREKALQGLSNLPSFSGIIGKKAEGEEEVEHSTVSATGSFAAVGATGSFAPVGDELVADLDPEDLYVEDADDSDYSENFTETGAFAGPGYVEMPKSRAAKFFDKFRFGRKKADEGIRQTPQEWLDVDDDFDARTVGKQRGSWASFQDSAQESDSHHSASNDDAIEATGEFSPVNAQYDDYDDSYEEQVTLPANSPFAQRANRGIPYDTAFAPDEETGYTPRKWNGGATSVDIASDVSGQAIEEEFRQIYQFRNPEIDTEVWFVALGSQLSGEAGMKAFLQDHASELRGAVVINLEALGDGTLTFMEKEGVSKTCAASSRMKRYIKKASSLTGVSCATSQMLWRESAASVAMSRGVQAMTLAGVSGDKPAHYCDADDTASKVNHSTLERNVEFIMAILKNI